MATLTDTRRLNKMISDSGKTKKHLASRLGLTTNGLSMKLRGETEFRSREIVNLCDELQIIDPRELCEIFFSMK